MAKQTDINAKMREILIDWLMEVEIRIKLHPETIYLTVSVLDRFLERRQVSITYPFFAASAISLQVRYNFGVSQCRFLFALALP